MKLTLSRKNYFFLFLFSLLFFTWGNQWLPVTDPVESNYALTAQEMVRSGNWISPQIYGIFWYDKPIMVYWMISLSYVLFGMTDFAVRFPAALCGAASVTLVCWYVRRIVKNDRIALWSAVMLATMLEYWVISHAVITDSLLFLFTVPTLFSAYIGLYENSRRHMTAAYGAAALACLTKGPVGLVLPGLLLLLWCGVMRSPRWIPRCFPWQGILLFLVLSLPWYGTMYAVHGMPFVEEFLGLHNFVRATSSEHPEQDVWYFYLLLLPISFLPWTGVVFCEMAVRFKSRDPFFLFLMVWCWGTVFFYTVMATKYVTYTYITLAPAAVLGALSLCRLTEGTEPRRRETVLLTVPAVLMMAVWTAATFRFPDGNWEFFYAIAAYTVFRLLWWLRKGSLIQTARLTALSAAAISVCLIAEGFPSFMHLRSSVDMAPVFLSKPGLHYFYKDYETSYTYYTGETAVRLLPTAFSMTQSSQPEDRSPLWNEKYVMPSVSDSEWIQTAHVSAPVYLYVSRGNEKLFECWSYRSLFVKTDQFTDGSIYQMVKNE